MVSLREVRVDDLPILFEHQLDPESVRMAACPARTRDAFMAHWTKILADPACAPRVILLDGNVAGDIGAWTVGSERLVGYRVAREHWGRGIATAALAQLIQCETIRPLTAHVVKRNSASMRVLVKCGFIRVGTEVHELPGGGNDEELTFRLGAAV